MYYWWYISAFCREIRPTPPYKICDSKLHVMVKGSSLGGLANVEYSFLAITPKTTLTQSCSTC